MLLEDLKIYLDEYLDVRSFSDPSLNGLRLKALKNVPVLQQLLQLH